MKRFTILKRLAWVAAVIAAGGQSIAAAAQQTSIDGWDRASHVIMPQMRAWPLRSGSHAVAIEAVSASVEIREHTAATTLEIRLKNASNAPAEGILLLPVPDGSAVSSFMFEGAASEPTARVLRADEARREYDGIVARLRDPALLEFAGYNLVRSSVFPVEPGGTQRIRLTYEHILGGDGNRIDYILPRSESLNQTAPWDTAVDIQSQAPISMVYSPSHDLVEDRKDAKRIAVRVAETSRHDPGAFRLSYLIERDGVTASLFAYPDPKVGGGYFLLLAGLPARISDADIAIRREVTLVLDRSGSMAGGKLDQVRDAALQIVEGLADGEAFNIIDYSNAASLFSASPVIKNSARVEDARAYLASLRPNGGTNIHDALLEAIKQKPIEGYLPIVLFLTDGLPTVSKTSEVAIRDMLQAGNVHKRRIFTFGVGADVNVPLLDRLAEITRATSAYVLPDEDVEVKVAQTFRRLYGPVLADVDLRTLDTGGNESTKMLRELIPNELPDVFEGDQIILLGQYREDEPITFRISGNYLGKDREFSFTFSFDNATTRNAFVPRLWASRRIAYLIDQVRQAGAIASTQPIAADHSILSDPKYKEIIDEIVRLSTEFGILSEYTSFLATEGTDLSDWNDLLTACSRELDTRAVRTRAGLSALNQSFNVAEGKMQQKLKYDNRYWNAQMESVQISNVQQINDCAFFKRGNQWIDAKLVSNQEEIQPDRIVEFGSEAHVQMLDELIRANRQGCLSLDGDILLQHDAEVVLVRNSKS